jgi:hypothetical protein
MARFPKVHITYPDDSAEVPAAGFLAHGTYGGLSAAKHSIQCTFMGKTQSATIVLRPDAHGNGTWQCQFSALTPASGQEFRADVKPLGSGSPEIKIGITVK